MMVIDIIIIVFLFAAIVSGYKRGVLKELYDLIILVISFGLGYLLRNPVADFILDNFGLEKFVKSKIEGPIAEIAIKYIGPFVGLIVAIIIIYIVMKIVFLVLRDKNIIPNRINKFNGIGSILAFLKSALLVSVIAFIMSFGQILNIEFVFKDSVLLDMSLKLNPPLYNLSNQIIEIYTDVESLQKALANNEEIDSLDEVVSIIKKIKETNLVTDEMLEDVTETFVFNEKEVDLTDLDFDKVKEELVEQEVYELVKELYDQEVITDEIIYNLLKNNNVQGVTEEDIKKLFE